MTAVEQVVEDLEPARHVLAPGARPEVIREHLLSEDRALLHGELAMAARTARRAAERNTGHASPPDEPLAVTRAKAGM